MTERGGPSTQSGIIYQNSIAALYLGRLCDSTPRLNEHAVINVRVEAPTHVDDTVITFRDKHRKFIQAKENIRNNDAAWSKLWKDFESQFWDGDFQKDKDRLLLHVGEVHEDHRALRDIGIRAITSLNHEEWISRLSNAQKSLLSKVSSLFDPRHSSDEVLFVFFRHFEVEIRPLEDIERDMVPYWIPTSNKSQIELFRLLRDRVGGAGRQRGSFNADDLQLSLAGESEVSFIIQPGLDELHELVRTCGAGLKQHKYCFGNTNVHLKRTVVEAITAWALRPSDGEAKDNIAILLDRAGMGKTVVSRDVLLDLEEVGAIVLAIKADQLSGITTSEELQANLHLPDSVERILRRIAAEDPVVLLIDQIDALSLSLARDQKALTVILNLVARAQLIPGVRILMSCRTFDFNNDPRLNNIESGKKFHLTELSDEEITYVIEKLQLPYIEYERLSPATKELLRIPLHLDLFTRAMGEQAAYRSEEVVPPHQIKSLQDLYTLLWQNVIRKPELQAPPIAERERAIQLLIERMDHDQRTAVPRSIFSAPETQCLESASQWLASQGILIPTGIPTDTVQASVEWTFLHQTFFDYCYAKSFVENHRPLFETVRDGDQGLFARPQIIQVLAYLRGTDLDIYTRELSKLLNATPAELRFHLRYHVLQWFGAVPDPNEQEWLLARRLLANPKQRARILGVAYGNIGWFNRLKEMLEHSLVSHDEETLDKETLPFLYSMLEVAQAEIVSMLRPYRGRSEKWDLRVRYLVRSIRNWKTDEAVTLFEEILKDVPVNDLKRYYELDDVAKARPQAGCRLIRIVFDRLVEEYISERESNGEERIWYSQLSHDLEILNGSTVMEALNAVTKAEPKYFLETMLPWLERVLRHKQPYDEDSLFFAADHLSNYWYGSPYVVQHQLNEAFINALTELAHTAPREFCEIAARVEALPYSTPQRYMAHIYSNVAGLFTEEALTFLTSDQRRLDLGDNEQYDTRQLIKAIVPHLTDEQFVRLQAAVLSYKPIKKYRGIGALRWYGLEQFYLLQCLPVDRLTPLGLRVLRELERKFPGVHASENPSTLRGGVVGSPIPDEIAKKMSDKAWLGAIKKYRGNVEHADFLKGGVMQLAGVLQNQVKEEPERFYRLAMLVPIETDQSYIRAFINGLAESSASAELMFNVVRRFIPIAAPDTKRAIFWSLQKRIDDGIPGDLIDILEGYVRGPANEDETGWLRDEEINRKAGREANLNGGPYSSYLNSERGSALMTLMRALNKRGNAEAISRKWELLEFVVSDGSIALHAGAIEELLYLLNNDRERAISLFEQLINGYPALLRSHYSDDFLYYGFYKNYFRMKPYIVAMMNEAHENIRQRGAELACIAAISLHAMESEEAHADSKVLAEKALTGEAPWRRGAARIYAANLNREPSELCVAGLIRLLDAEDKEVQKFISDPFTSLREENIFSLRQFIEAYADSRSLYSGLSDFAEYLWKHGPLDPPWALSMVEKILNNSHGDQSELRFAGGEELIRLVLRVYTDPSIEKQTREHAMDVFDQLMERFMGPAQMILKEWDRR
jgi:hypothetical protein